MLGLLGWFSIGGSCFVTSAASHRYRCESGTAGAQGPKASLSPQVRHRGVQKLMEQTSYDIYSMIYIVS